MTSKLPPYEVYLIKIAVLIKALWKSSVRNVYHPLEYLCETSIADSTCMKLMNVKNMHHPPEYLCETSIADSTCMKLIMMCYDCAASRTAPGLLQCQWRCCQCAGRRGAYLEYQVQEGNSRIHLPLPGQTQFPFFVLNPAWDCGSKKSVQSPKPFLYTLWYVFHSVEWAWFQTTLSEECNPYQQVSTC